VNVWNSLPDHVVNVATVNMFKAHLDKFWEHQQVYRYGHRGAYHLRPFFALCYVMLCYSRRLITETTPS